MPPKSVHTKVVNRFVNSFTSQVVRRGLRSVGTPNMIVPALIGIVRQVNHQIQWGNSALWKQRLERAKELLLILQEKQNEVSPVYRFRGGSANVRPHLSNETVRDRIRDPSLNQRQNVSGKRRFDSSTILLGGLSFVIVASMAGPALAKRVNYVDPLDLKESNMKGSTEGIQLKH